MTETCILLNGKWTFSEQLTNDCCNELVLDFWIAPISYILDLTWTNLD